MKEKYTLRVKKGKNKPLEPKIGIWAPKLVWPCDISIDRKFHGGDKNYTLRGQMGENKSI
jgi:hypothetical protein